MNNIQRFLLALLGIVIAGFLVWYFSNIVGYILVAVVISFIGRPLVDGLVKIKIGRFRIPHALAATFSLLSMWFLFVFFFYNITPLVISEFSALRELDYLEVANRLETPINKLNEFISSYFGERVDIVQTMSIEMRKMLNTTNAMGIFNSITGQISGVLIGLFSVTFMSFFFLKDSGLFMKGVLVFTPTRYQENVEEAFHSIKKLLVRYFLGLFLEVFIVFALISIGLWIVGLKFSTALVIGIFAGLLNTIPYIGPLIGTLLGVIIALLTNINLPFYTDLLPLCGFSLLVFAIVQLLDNIILQPFIYSSSVFAHPLEIFLLILIAGSLAGPMGMILAVPSYTILRVVAYEFFAQYEIVKRLTKSISHERK